MSGGKKLNKQEETALLDQLEEALQEPFLRSSVSLGIFCRHLVQDMGAAHAILLLAEQTRRMIDGLIEDPEVKTQVKLAIIEDLADEMHQVSPEDLGEVLEELNDKVMDASTVLTKKKDELN